MSRTDCCKKNSLIVALFAVAILATSASAQTCLQNEYNQVNKQKLNCTANDVRIAKVTNIRDPLTGATLTSCINGALFDFIADFEIVTTSAQARENIGLYIASNSQTQALTGACVDNIISPQHPCHTGSSIMCGSDNYHETDAPPDNCGDTSSSDNSTTFGAGAEKVTLEIDNFLCQAPAGSNQVQLPNCTSWQIPGGTIQCVSASPSFPYPFDANNKPEAIPGSPSKCNCGIIPLGVTVQNPSVAVTKACTTNATPGNTNTTCSITPEGGSVTYTVTVDNQSNFGDIVVDQICDDQYGNIFTASGFTPACPAGTIGTKGALVSTTCSALTVSKGTPQACTFTATQVEDVTVTDTVTIKGHGATAGTFGPSSSNSVTVVSHEADTTATVTKSVVSTTAGCATVRYGVDVQDTSAAGSDETVTLSALNDSAFGSITSVHDSVLGTTCGIATNVSGLGTLSGSSGAGTLSTTIAVGGHYTCQFDAQFCGALTSITLPDASTCNGIKHSNKVTGTEAGDESETVTESANTLTVYECFTSTSSSQ
jgi:hypothetical protein